MRKPHEGTAGEPLPDEDFVLRLGRLPKDLLEERRASPNWFELSEEDKAQEPPKLSVFCDRLTTPEQAWNLLANKESYVAYGRLNVADVRHVKPDANMGMFQPLN